MGRPKMVMKLIEDRKSRSVTFKKRKEGLKKKAFEFSTLCDVDACMICFKEDSNEPLTWPEERSEVRRIIRRYHFSNSSLNEKKKKKRKEKLIIRSSQQGEDYASCKPIYDPCRDDDRISDSLEESLRNLGSHLDGKVEMVRKRIQLLEDTSSNGPLLQQPNQQQQQQQMQVSKLDDELQPLPFSSYLIPLEQQLYSGLPESLHTPAAAFGGLMPDASNSGKFNYNGTNMCLSSYSSLNLFVNPGAGMVPLMISSAPPGMMMGRESNETFAYNASFHQEQWFDGHQHFGVSSDFRPSSQLHFETTLLYPPQAHHLDHDGWSEFHDFELKSSLHQEQWFEGDQHFGVLSDFQPSSPLHFDPDNVAVLTQAHHLDHDGWSEFHDFELESSFHQEQCFHGHQHFGVLSDFLPSSPLHFDPDNVAVPTGTSFGSWVV